MATRKSSSPRTRPPSKAPRASAASAPGATTRPTASSSRAKSNARVRGKDSATAKPVRQATAKANRKSSLKGQRARTPALPQVVTAGTMMQALSMAQRHQGQTIGFVPTMGALHEGHAALLREARARADVVVVSIFVNPMQFGAREDLSKYPRDLEADLAICARSGVDIVFAPDVESIYPDGFQTTVHAGELARAFEGTIRPGHFDGVLTVVTKLFHLVQPHFAVFGEKDFQQLQVVRRMTRDLHLPVEIVAIPVIREVDGLALSSRNRYLSPNMRAKATCLYRALDAAQERVAAGERRCAKVIAAAREVLDAEPHFCTEYVAVVDPQTLSPVRTLNGPARLLLAGRLGKRPSVRLIDNGPLFLPYG